MSIEEKISKIREMGKYKLSDWNKKDIDQFCDSVADVLQELLWEIDRLQPRNYDE